ncbi:TPA: hypothetical protein EYP75_00560, partial [Candidatus Bathyarchaeota archaeon]|nr:hypothetical protein [Candidatus Bathyarchaeota archaeon]
MKDGCIEVKIEKGMMKMSVPVRFGILGLGVGAGRARLVSKTEDAELMCVCDLQEEKARQIADELNCEWTTRYDK